MSPRPAGVSSPPPSTRPPDPPLTVRALASSSGASVARTDDALSLKSASSPAPGSNQRARAATALSPRSAPAPLTVKPSPTRPVRRPGDANGAEAAPSKSKALTLGAGGIFARLTGFRQRAGTGGEPQKCQVCAKKKVKGRVALDSGEQLFLCKVCLVDYNNGSIHLNAAHAVAAAAASSSPATALPSGDAALLFKQQQIERYAKQERETVVMMRVEQSQAEQDVSNLSSEELRNRISRSTSIRSTLTPAQQLIAARAAAAAAGGKHKQQMTAQSQRTPAPASAVPAKITVVQRHSSDRSSLVADQNKLASCEGCKDVVSAASLISYGDTGVLLCNSCVTRQDAHTSSMLMSLEQARAVNTRLMCEDCGTRPALTRREVCQQCLDVRRAEEAGDLTGSSAAPSLNASLTNSNPDRPFANGLRSTAGQPGALLAVPGKAPAKPDLVVDSDDDLPPPPPPDDASPRSSAFVPSSGEYITLDLAGRNTGAAAAAAAAGHNAQYGTHMQYGTLPSGGSSIKSQLATSVANDGDVDDEATSIDELDELDVPPPLDSGVFSQPLLNGVDQPAPKLSAIDPSVTLPKLVFNPNKPSGGSRRALPSVPGSRETIEVPKMPLPTTPGEAAAKVAPAAAPAVVVTPAAPSVEPPAPTTQSPGIGDEHALQPNKQMSIRRRIASTAAKNWMVEYDEIEFHQKIGAGSFGEVWTAELWGMECAVKKLPENLISEEAVGDFLSELEILAGLRHPNIVLMIGAVISDDGGRMAIISELCSRGSVNSVLQNAALQSELTLGRRAHFALDCAFAMLYLHKLNICHADLKARNLLIDKDWNAKLCDFGLSMVRTDKTVRLAGTRGYMAPELMEFFGDIYDGRAEMIFTFKSDVYSYGILMSELYCSNDAELVDWANTNEELEAISRGDRPAIPPRMHAAWRSLQERAWSQSPDERPQFKEILAELKPLVREWDAQGAIYPILD